MLRQNLGGQIRCIKYGKCGSGIKVHVCATPNVRFWLCFGLKTVIDFAHFAVELYTGLLEHYDSVRMCSLLQL